MFLISQIKRYVVTPHQNRLDELALMVGHNIHLVGIIWKIIPFTPSYLKHCSLKKVQGQVVQSIVSLMSLLRGQFVKCFTTL